LIPPLHVGGVQEAVTFAAPTAAAVAIPKLPKTVLVDPDAVVEIGFEVLQVRGTPVSVIPKISVTVAFSVVLVPAFTSREVAGLPAAAMEIVCTGHVSTGRVWLFNPLAEAKIIPSPGTLAETISSFNAGVVAGVDVRFTIALDPVGLTPCHENGPTLEVMSLDPFIAVA
jgi:hypothetical protein